MPQPDGHTFFHTLLSKMLRQLPEHRRDLIRTNFLKLCQPAKLNGYFPRGRADFEEFCRTGVASPDILDETGAMEICLSDLCTGCGHIMDAAQALIADVAPAVIASWPANIQVAHGVSCEKVKWKIEYNLKHRIPDFFYSNAEDFKKTNPPVPVPREYLQDIQSTGVPLDKSMLKRLRSMWIGFPCAASSRRNVLGSFCDILSKLEPENLVQPWRDALGSCRNG